MARRLTVFALGSWLSALLVGGLASLATAQELPLPAVEEGESIYTPHLWQPETGSIPTASKPLDSYASPVCEPAGECAPSVCEPDPTCCENFCVSPYLTGDWGGIRQSLAESGIVTQFDETLYYFGVTRGGLNRNFELSGHGDYVLNFDMGKLAGREGLFLKVRGEHRYGDSINRDAGALLPATISPDLPTPDHEDLYITNFLITQALSENFAVFAGKIDSLDGDANAFAHGRGKTQFSNMGMVANPIALRTMPYSTLAAGFSILHELQPVFTFMVVNPTDTARTTGLGELFAEGVTLAAEARVPTNFLDLPGHQLIGGTWSSRDYVAIGQDPRIILPNVPIARQADSWSLYWNFDQYLVTYSDEKPVGWGVFGRAGIGDDRTNPLASFLSFGIGGDSPFRHQDTFGIGWYRSNTSDEIGPLLPALLGPIGDGQGVELFYNIQVTPWFRLTPDVQFLDPARQNVDDAIIFGLRGQFIL